MRRQPQLEISPVCGGNPGSRTTRNTVGRPQIQHWHAPPAVIAAVKNWPISPMSFFVAGKKERAVVKSTRPSEAISNELQPGQRSRRLTRPSGIGSNMPSIRCRPQKTHQMRVSRHPPASSTATVSPQGSRLGTQFMTEGMQHLSASAMQPRLHALNVSPICAASSRWGISAR